MPMPWSLTRSTASGLSCATLTAMRLPGGLYFTALITRFEMIWSRRMASASTQTESSCATTTCRLMRPDALIVASAWRAISARSTARCWSTILPDCASRVEKVVGEPREVRDLAGDDAARLLTVALVEPALLHHRGGVGDRAQR